MTEMSSQRQSYLHRMAVFMSRSALVVACAACRNHGILKQVKTMREPYNHTNLIPSFSKTFFLYIFFSLETFKDGKRIEISIESCC